MLKIVKSASDQIDLTLSGKLDEAQMRNGLENLLELSEGMKDAKMLYKIDDFEWPTLSALAVEFSMMPRLFSLITRFERCALLCDEGWLRSAAKLESFIIPGLTIETFDRNDMAGAQKWLDTGSS